MAPTVVQYHWVMAPLEVISPDTYENYSTSITLPAQHTLRRILVANTAFWWKRGSVGFEDQQAYFVTYEVKYGNTLGAPVLYRSTRKIPHVLAVNASGITDVFCSIHSAGDLEVGFNEKVQRGGWDSGPVELTLKFFIHSSGGGGESLVGDAGMPLRALYSLIVPP